MATERTPLRSGPAGPGATDHGTTYMFTGSTGRLHRSKIRQFQCCVCAAVLGVFVMALIITIAYSVEHETDGDNSTTPSPPGNGTLRLLQGSSWPIPDAAAPPWPVTNVSPEAMRAAMQAGREDLVARASLEARTPPMQLGTPSYRANQAVKTRPEAVSVALRGTLEERATQHLLKASGHTPSWRSPVGRGPRLQDADPACAEDDLPLPCPATPYRSADGTCNNLQHPRTWGVAMRPFRRVMPAVYDDGFSAPRTSGLPSAREVSVTVHRPLYRDDPDFTVMLAVWGQFLDHDITATALSQRLNGSAISCCDVTEQHPECFPVSLAAGDPYYHKYNLTCMEFVRSAPARTCSLGPREQLNQASSFLDGSVVYGPSPQLMTSLRDTTSGMLKMSPAPDGRELLPVSDDPNDGCNRDEMNKRGRYCFMSGDARANENLHLTTLHLLWARQHNRLSSRLHKLNPHWSDEKVFQETRKIVAAQIQHITYNEFLPVVLGPHLMESLQLAPKRAGYYTDYDPEVDPTICNSFAASSFRFAHTLLPGLLKLIGNDTSSPEFVELHQMLFDPYSLYSRDGADRALRGAMETGIERADNYFNPELTERLFLRDTPRRSIGHGSAGHPACGLDLVSLNVQRGRDHGLPPYPAWREHCGYSRPRAWEDLQGVVDADSLNNMKKIYKTVDDVDVYTGSLSEYPVEGGLLGETVTCMLTDQFVRLKRGDRFWYETDEKPQAFTPAQLAEIRKTSLAGVICGTSDGVHAAQPQVMRRAHGSNERKPCAALPRTNLRAWVERDGRFVVSDAGVLKATDNVPPPEHQDGVSDDDVLVTEGTAKTENDDVPSTARAVRVGGRVTAGSLVTDAGTTLWSGALPLHLPAELLAKGLRWEGTLMSSAGTATLDATVSLSRGVSGAPSPLQGHLNLQFDILWETSKDGVIDVSGSFRSPVHLRSTQSTAIVTQDGPELMAPVVLDGNFSNNNTFQWNGNFTFILPTSKNFYTDDALMLSSQARAPYPAERSENTSQKHVVEVEVLSGRVVAKLQGQKEVVWWNGSLPFQLPGSPFDVNNKSLPSTYEKPHMEDFSSIDGIMWSAKVAPSSEDSTGTYLMGSFKLPRFVHGPSPRIEWWSGSFSLEIRLPKEDNLRDLLGEGLVTSRILFQSEETPLENKRPSNSVLSLVSTAQQLVEEAVPVPIIFKGAFAPDRSTFTWGGKLVMILPALKPEAPALELLGEGQSSTLKYKSPYWGVMKVVARVTSGKVVSTAGSALWSGALPAAIPRGPHAVVWNGSLSTAASGLVVQGSYSLPQRSSSGDPFPLEWSEGSFSFNAEVLWSSGPIDDAIHADDTFISPLYLKSAYTLEDSDDMILLQDKGLGAFVAESAGSLVGARRAPVILQGITSSDGATFDWDGNVVMVFPYRRIVPNLAPIAAPLMTRSSLQTAAAGTSEMRVGIRVTSGSVYAYPEGAWFWRTWWSGNLPASIPVPLFDSHGTETASYPTGPVFHACGIEWKGSIIALSATEIQLKGKFSFPHYEHSTSGLSITWYYGMFDLKANLLWDAPVHLSSDDLYSHLYFRSDKMQRFPVTAPHASLLQFAMDGQELTDGAKLHIPVVLDGSFTDDHSAFLWSGDAVLSVPLSRQPPSPPLMATIQPLLKADSSKVNKPVKAQISGTVIGGFVNASFDNSSSSTIWSGVAPMWLPNPLFGVSSYTLPQFIKWSGSVEVNDINKVVEFSGTFSMPFYESSGTVVHQWKGNFLVRLQMLWVPKYDLSALRKQITYSSRVILVPPTQSAPGSSPVPTIVFASENGDGVQTTIRLQGTNSFWSSSWFWWTGGASISIPLADNSIVTQSAGGAGTRKQRNVAFAVVEGSLQQDNQSDGNIVWSGSLPVDFPSREKSEHAQIVKWTPETVKPLPNGETMLNGTFTYPKFLNASHSVSGGFSVQWLTGKFSVVTRQVGVNSVLSSIQENRQYFSPLIFLEMKSNETVFDLVTAGLNYAAKQDFLTAGDAFAEDAERLPILLQGSYSPDRSTFSWTGNAILKTSQVYGKNKLKGAASDATKKTVIKKQGKMVTKIGALVVGGSVSGQKSGGSVETLWSGSFPVSLPSSAGGNSHGLFWTGSLNKTSGAMAVLSGNFSAPQAGCVSGRCAEDVIWWSGNFSFTLQLLWNVTDGALAPGSTFFSTVYYRPRSWDNDNWQYDDAEQLAALSEEVVRGAPRAIVILDGSYSSDNSSFLWTGKAIIVLLGKPGPSIATPLLLTSVAPALAGRRASLGVKVSGGTLSPSVWGGTLPVSIPVAAVKQIRPFSWRATGVSVTSTGAVTVKGMYSARVPPAPEGAWQEGDFSFSGSLLWNNLPAFGSLEGSNFTSAIYLQHADASERWSALAPAPHPHLWPSEWQVAAEGSRAPVILQGRFSQDGQTFEWLGNAVVAIPAM